MKTNWKSPDCRIANTFNFKRVKLTKYQKNSGHVEVLTNEVRTKLTFSLSIRCKPYSNGIV